MGIEVSEGGQPLCKRRLIASRHFFGPLNEMRVGVAGFECTLVLEGWGEGLDAYAWHRQ